MIIKTFIAPDLEKVLWLLNEELGPAAVVLRTRLINGNPPGKNRYLELTAALDSALYRRDIPNLKLIPGEPPHADINSGNSIFPFSQPDVAQMNIVEVIGW